MGYRGRGLGSNLRGGRCQEHLVLSESWHIMFFKKPSCISDVLELCLAW